MNSRKLGGFSKLIFETKFQITQIELERKKIMGTGARKIGRMGRKKGRSSIKEEQLIHTQ